MNGNMARKLNVMVTGIGGGGCGEQILKALRMAKDQYTIIGADVSPTSIGLMEVDYPYILPPANDKRYLDELLSVCRKHNVKVIFNGSDPELKLVSKHRISIENEGIFLPINPANVLDTCMDKFKTMEFLKQNNFLFPETVQITSINDIEKINYLPLILKPSIGGGGSTNTYIAQTKDELEMFAQYLLNYSKSIIAQQYIGRPDSEYTIGVLVSMEGKLLNSIAVKRNILSGLSNRIKVKNVTGNPEFGPILAISSGISQGEIGKFPEVTKQAEEISSTLGCRGAVNIQCRLVDKKIYIFEINPRFSGTTSLRALVGYNEPDILIRNQIFGEKITPYFKYKSGMITRGLREKLVTGKK